MIRFRPCLSLAALALLSKPIHARNLDFKEFMAATTRANLAVHSARESERIWDKAELDNTLGWDRNLNLEWRKLDVTEGKDRTQGAASLVQGTPYGLQGQLQYADPDAHTGQASASVGVQIDLLRNRLGNETAQQRELLNLRKEILGLQTQDALFQSCVSGLNSVSRFLLMDRQEKVYSRMLSVRQKLRGFVQKKVSQGALSRAELLSVEAEMTAVTREVQALQQAKAEWRAVESIRLSEDITDLAVPSDAAFIQFDFIAQQNSAWLPELDLVKKKAEESQARLDVLREQQRGSLKVFGQKVGLPDDPGRSRFEYGLSLSLPLADFAGQRDISMERLEQQELLLKKHEAERKATMLLAETRARIESTLQRLRLGEKNLKSYLGLDAALWEQYRTGAVGLERLLRQDELRLREELVQEQILHELRQARTVYVLMQSTRPDFCEGV